MSEPASPREQALIEAGDRLRDDLAVMRSDEILEGPIAMLLGDLEADLDRWDAAAGEIEPVHLGELSTAARDPWADDLLGEHADFDYSGLAVVRASPWLLERDIVPRWLLAGLALSTICSSLWALLS